MEQYICVLNNDGTPLMPTTRRKHVDDLLRTGRARKVSSAPFIIRLKYHSPGITQPLTCGIDPGRTNIGVAVVREDGTAHAFAAFR